MNQKRLSTRPLYLQLRDALAERVASGHWKPGRAIPNETDLAREFGVSARTMRKALDLMETEHLVTRRQGRGTFINDQTSDDLAVRLCNLRSSDGHRVAGELRGEAVCGGEASEAEGERLRLTAADRVYRIRRLRIDKGRPIMVEDVVLPAALFPSLRPAEAAARHILALAQQHGILLGRAEERIRIRMAMPAFATLLGVADDTPLLLLDRVIFTLDGRPAEWRLGYCHLGEGYSYVSEMK
jgi:GntR family transcriptional regulator